MAEFDCLGELSHSQAEISLVGFQSDNHLNPFTNTRSQSIHKERLLPVRARLFGTNLRHLAPRVRTCLFLFLGALSSSLQGCLVIVAVGVSYARKIHAPEPR